MNEASHWTLRLRCNCVAFAARLGGALLAAASGRTWMPGHCHGTTAMGSLLGERRSEHD